MRHRDWVPGLCRWCAGRCTGRRRTFCSDRCVHEYNLRNDAKYYRDFVWARDHGICQLCGVDLSRLERVCMILRLDIDRVDFFSHHERRYKSWKEGSLELAFLQSIGFSPNPNKALYEVDHIIPVCEGGGFCGPENLRLLCEPCHDEVTQELKTRLQAKRALSREPKRGVRCRR